MLSYQRVRTGGPIASADSQEKVNDFLPDLENLIGGGLVALEKREVIHSRHDRPKPE